MKYIHSIWSAPSIKNNFDNEYDVKYLTKNFYSYLLSALLIQKLGYRIELFCDKYSYEMYAKIPYNDIHIIDFDADGISSKFWIYGKIKAHTLMNEPYVHIDGDVFLFRDIINKNLINGRYSVAVQSLENEITIGDSFKKLYLDSITPLLNFENIKWDKYGYQAYNCGVIGFSDMVLKNEYANTVKSMLFELSNSSNFDDYRKKYDGMFLLAEQTFLHYLLNEMNIKPFEIIPYETITKYYLSGMNWYETIPSQIGYCHLLGYSKYKDNVLKKIRFKIIKYFPEYQSIIDEFENNYSVV